MQSFRVAQYVAIMIGNNVQIESITVRYVYTYSSTKIVGHVTHMYTT